MSDSNRRNSQGRRVAYTAVGTALALAMITLSAYVPFLTVAPLLIVALSWNVVMDKCGVGYGIVSIAATVGLGFLTAFGNYAVMIIVGIIFVPYALIVFFISKLIYKTPKTAAIRFVIMAAFASLALLGMYFTAEFIIGYMDIGAIITAVSNNNFAVGYFVLNLIAVVLVVIFDFMYIYLRANIVRRLKY